MATVKQDGAPRALSALSTRLNSANSVRLENKHTLHANGLLETLCRYIQAVLHCNNCSIKIALQPHMSERTHVPRHANAIFPLFRQMKVRPYSDSPAWEWWKFEDGIYETFDRKLDIWHFRNNANKDETLEEASEICCIYWVIYIQLIAMKTWNDMLNITNSSNLMNAIKIVKVRIQCLNKI